MATVVSVFTVVVATAEELGGRAASALLGHPAVETVGVFDRDPPKSWGNRARRVASPSGFDVGIGVDGARVRVFRRTPRGEGIGWASPAGLAMAARCRVEGPATCAVTVPGRPLSDGEAFVFPPPIGWSRGVVGPEDVYECPVEGPHAGALARGRSGETVATSDDALFLNAICLAAGAVVAAERPGIGEVWEAAEDYLAACEALGVVLAASG